MLQIFFFKKRIFINVLNHDPYGIVFQNKTLNLEAKTGMQVGKFRSYECKMTSRVGIGWKQAKTDSYTNPCI